MYYLLRGVAVKYFFTLIISILFSSYIFSQSRLIGKVLDSKELYPLEYASVVVKDMSDSVVSGGVTDKSGNFNISVKSGEGKYSLNISYMGYDPLITNIDIIKGENKILEPFKLLFKSDLLSEAVVTSNYRQRVTDIEKTTINATSSVASVSGSVLDLIKTASNITIDNGGAISIRGNSNVVILIDGVPTTLGSLDGISANSVGSIEIITNPGVKYDSEGTGGIINIISKRDKRDGYSVGTNINWSPLDRVNGNISLSQNRNGFSIGVNYSAKYNPESVNSNLHRFFHSTGNSVDQTIESSRREVINTLVINGQNRFKSGDIFKFSAKYSQPDIRNSQFLTILDNSINDNNYTNRENLFYHKRRMGEVLVEYIKELNKDKSKISLSSSFSRTRGRRPGYYYQDGEPVQKSKGGGHPTNFYIQTDYTNKIKGFGELEMGLKYFIRGNNFKFDSYTYNPIDLEWVYNDFFSSDLTYRENIYSWYIGNSNKISSSLSLKSGLRLEYSVSHLDIKKESEQIDRDNLFVSPYLSLNKTLSSDRNLSFLVSRRISRPTYPQINPFINMIDRSVYETGNRNIKPEISNRVEAMFNGFKDVFSYNISLYYNWIDDYITQIASLYDTDALMLTYENGDCSRKLGSDISIRYKPWSYMEISVGSSLFLGENTGVVNDIDLYGRFISYSGNLSLTLIPSKKDQIIIQSFYTSPITYPQFESKEVYYTDISYKRDLIKNRLAVSATITDIFNSRVWDIKTDNAVYRLTNRSKNESRAIWVGLSFNLNRKAVSKESKDSGDSGFTDMIRLGY